MKWYYMKVRPNEGDNTLFVHYGIPRTGSSTVRFLIRRYCNILGIKWEAFEAQRSVVSSDCRYLLVEIPYPVHLSTDKTCRYITTLRDPVKALFSLYFWLNKVREKITLEDFVQRLPESYNVMSRWLIRLNDLSVNPINRIQPVFMDDTTGFFDYVSDDELYRSACEAIENKIALIGILEQFVDFAFAMLDFCSWKVMPVYMRTNFSVKPKDWSFNSLESAMKKKILSCTAVDRRLFSYVRESFKHVSAGVHNKYGKIIEQYRYFCRKLDDSIVQNHGLTMEGEHIVSQNWVEADYSKPMGIEINANIQQKLGVIEIEDWLSLYYPLTPE